MTSGTSSYGVWAGTPSSYTSSSTSQSRISLKFTDNNTIEREAAINTRSPNGEGRVIYWIDRNFNHPVTTFLKTLDLGFHASPVNGNGPFNLDYYRTTPPLFDLVTGTLVADRTEVEAQLQPILDNAIQSKATIYIFGSSSDTSIDQIHCNQGNNPRSRLLNATFSDGALIFHFPSDGHYEAIFLAFADQAHPTNDLTGAPVPSSASLKSVVRNGSGSASGSGSGSIGDASSGGYGRGQTEGRRSREHKL